MRGTLTSIQAPVRGSRRRTLFIDGEPWFTTSRDVVARLELEADTAHDLDELRSAIDETVPAACRARAIQLLARRDYGTAELVKRLSDEGLPAEGCARTVEELRSCGYVDDERRAASMARGLLEVRGYGRARVLRTMTAKGLDPELAARVLDAAETPEDEAGRARKLAARLAPAARGSVDRLAARLLRKGFAPGVALGCAREALASDVGEEPPGLLDP